VSGFWQESGPAGAAVKRSRGRGTIAAARLTHARFGHRFNPDEFPRD